MYGKLSEHHFNVSIIVPQSRGEGPKKDKNFMDLGFQSMTYTIELSKSIMLWEVEGG